MRWEDLKKGNYLFKYRDWHDKDGYNRQNLQDKILYIAKPSDFEDKLDCHYKEILEDKEAWAVSSFAKLYENVGFTGLCKWIMSYKLYEESSLSNPDFEDNWKNEWKTIVDERIGVLSLSLIPDGNDLWNKHAKEHTGFCLVLDKDQLISTILPYYFFGESDVVTYQNSVPKIDMTNFSKDEMHRRFFTKLKGFEFEHEYRCIRFQINKDMTRFIPIENSLRFVIVGKNMNKDDEQDLRKIVNQNWSNVQVINEQNIEL